MRNGAKALDFYKAAFGATESYKLETPDGIIAKLSVDGAEFWISGESAEHDHAGPESTGGNTIRMILTVTDPEAMFLKALQAGATGIFPVGVEHGWKLGRIADPFGLHWEIGHPVDA